MNDQHGFSRRSFMSMTLTVGSGLLLPWRNDAAMLSESVSLLWFDPARTEARGLATILIHRGTTTLAITGDRIRLRANICTEHQRYLQVLPTMLISSCLAVARWKADTDW